MALVWTNLDGAGQTLAYRTKEDLVPLRTLFGPATLTVLADLESQTYSISIDGVQVKSGMPFNQGVNLDTVRFLTNGMDETNFEGRCFDDLEISVPSSTGTQGSGGFIAAALDGLRSTFINAWQWLGNQISSMRQVFAPDVAQAATLDDPVFRSYYFAGNTRVAMRVEGDPTADGLYFFLHDHLGSTTVTLKRNVDTGVLEKVAELRYNPWGKERASGFDASLTPTDYRFTDQRIETSFGLYHYDARWFDPTYGRFVQADTLIQDIRNPQLLDRYAYTLNNPVKYSDPTGHLVCSEVPWEEGCQMTEGQEDLMLATREYHKMSYEGRSAFQAYKYMATHDGWWNENDGDFTFEDFMGITLLNEMGTEVNALNKMIDANTNQLWMNAHEGGGHDAYCKTSPCYAGALNFLSQSHSFWGRYHAWKSTGEIGKPNRYGKNYNEYDIGASLLTFDVSRIAYNPDAAYNWGNDANWAAAIDAALAGNPVEKIIGYAPSQIVYYNPIGDFIIFTIGQVSYWR